MNRQKKILTFLTGFIVGCIILVFIPRELKEEKEEPVWKKQIAPDNYYPLTLEDAYKRKITLDRQPWRVISLAPSVTEILFALNAGDRLVADTDWCRYPPAAEGLPKVGNLDSPNREIIIQFRPTLVLGSSLTPQSVYEQLQGAGLPAFSLAHSSLDTVINDIRTTGKLLGIPKEAFLLIRDIEGRRDIILNTLGEKGDATRPKTVLLYSIDGLYSAGKGSWPGDMINICGGQNIADNASSAWPALSIEGILEADPEVIIIATANPDGPVINQRIAKMKSDPIWQRLSAIKNDRVCLIHEDLLNIPGPRMIEGLEKFAHFLHPEAFSKQKE